MKKLLFFFCILFTMLACNKDINVLIREKERISGRRTVLIYMAAQNSLAPYNVTDSIEVMKGVKYLGDRDRVLMLIDRGDNTRMYEVVRGLNQPRMEKEWSDLNAANHETLRMALEYMKNEFHSDEYALVLWSHATGWVPSPKNVAAENDLATGTQAFNPTSADTTTKKTRVPTRNNVLRPNLNQPQSFGVDVGKGGNVTRDRSSDGNYPDEMEIADMTNAIQQSGVYLEYILFDCCLMQGIETLYSLRNVTKYIAGSPIEVSAEGGNYTDLLYDGLFANNIHDLGVSYTRPYLTGSQTISGASRSNFGVVFSIIRTDSLQALADTVRKYLPTSFKRDDLGVPLYPNLSNLQQYGIYHSLTYRPHYYDMQHALSHIITDKTALRSIKRAIRAATVYKEATPNFNTDIGVRLPVLENEYCGISMFVPQHIYQSNAVRSPHGNLNVAFRKTAWYEAGGWRAAGW